MKADFNLVDDGWIKLSGVQDPVSLRQIFDMTDPPELAGTPIQKMIVFRLLLAIVQVACPLEDEDDYLDLSVEEMKAQVRTYLEQKKACFYLLDADRPFLQHPGVKVLDAKKLLPLAAFLPGVCSGNATLLFDNNCQPASISDSDRVYALLSVVTFGMGGKKPDKALVFSKGLVKKARRRLRLWGAAGFTVSR